MPHRLSKGPRVTLPTQNDERKSHFSTRQTLEAVAVVTWFTGLTALMTFPLVAHLGDSLPSDLGDPLLALTACMRKLLPPLPGHAQRHRARATSSQERLGLHREVQRPSQRLADYRAALSAGPASALLDDHMSVAVCAALCDQRKNPERRYVEEGPEWHGVRVLRW